MSDPYKENQSDSESDDDNKTIDNTMDRNNTTHDKKDDYANTLADISDITINPIYLNSLVSSPLNFSLSSQPPSQQQQQDMDIMHHHHNHQKSLYQYIPSLVSKTDESDWMSLDHIDPGKNELQSLTSQSASRKREDDFFDASLYDYFASCDSFFDALQQDNTKSVDTENDIDMSENIYTGGDIHAVEECFKPTLASNDMCNDDNNNNTTITTTTKRVTKPKHAPKLLDMSNIPQCMLEEGFHNVCGTRDDDDDDDPTTPQPQQKRKDTSVSPQSRKKHKSEKECDCDDDKDTKEGIYSNNTDGKEKNTHREHIASQHQCPVCRDLIVSPVSLLPCNHKFCKSCLCGIDIESEENDNKFFTTKHKCPACRRANCHAIADTLLDRYVCEMYPNTWESRIKTTLFNTIVSDNRRRYFESSRFRDMISIIDDIFSSCPIYERKDFYAIFQSHTPIQFHLWDVVDDSDENYVTETEIDFAIGLYNRLGKRGIYYDDNVTVGYVSSRINATFDRARIHLIEIENKDTESKTPTTEFFVNMTDAGDSLTTYLKYMNGDNQDDKLLFNVWHSCYVALDYIQYDDMDADDDPDFFVTNNLYKKYVKLSGGVRITHSDYIDPRRERFSKWLYNIDQEKLDSDFFGDTSDEEDLDNNNQHDNDDDDDDDNGDDDDDGHHTNNIDINNDDTSSTTTTTNPMSFSTDSSHTYTSNDIPIQNSDIPQTSTTSPDFSSIDIRVAANRGILDPMRYLSANLDAKSPPTNHIIEYDRENNVIHIDGTMFYYDPQYQLPENSETQQDPETRDSTPVPRLSSFFQLDENDVEVSGSKNIIHAGMNVEKQDNNVNDTNDDDDDVYRVESMSNDANLNRNKTIPTTQRDAYNRVRSRDTFQQQFETYNTSSPSSSPHPRQ